MSTNYYAFGPHKGTDDGDAGLHIGKKSVGWRFTFRAHPHLQLSSFGSWVDYLSRPDVEIADEYGSEVSLPEMIATMSQTHDSEGPLRDHSEFADDRNRFQLNGFDFIVGYFC